MQIKNWHKFQHFKDRKPLWIKLYSDLINDLQWHTLEAPAAKLLVMLWILASEDENRQGYLPDIKVISFRCRISEKELLKSLPQLTHWVIEDDIKLISGGYQVDSPEKSRVEKRRVEKEKEKSSASHLPLNDKVKYLDFVYLKAEEHAKLTERFGAAGVAEKIEKLNNYIGSKGVKYKSHYHTILNWAAKDVPVAGAGGKITDSSGYDPDTANRLRKAGIKID